MTSQLDHPAAWRKAHRRRLTLVGLGPVEMLHRRFETHRLRGEWFKPAPEILEAARSLEGA